MAKSNFNIEIPKSELRKLGKTIKRFEKQQDSRTKQAISAAGLVMESKAKDVVEKERRVDTGRLRSSILYVSIDNGYGARLNSSTKGKKGGDSISQVEYAGYINDGTSRIRGIHYMEKAFQDGVRKFKQLMGMR